VSTLPKTSSPVPAGLAVGRHFQSAVAKSLLAAGPCRGIGESDLPANNTLTPSLPPPVDLVDDPVCVLMVKSRETIGESGTSRGATIVANTSSAMIANVSSETVMEPLPLVSIERNALVVYSKNRF
jgi:hypothetical protein